MSTSPALRLTPERAGPRAMHALPLDGSRPANGTSIAQTLDDALAAE